MFFAYVGFDAVSTAAQEAETRSAISRFGMLVSLGICTVIYVAVAIVLIGIVPYGELNVADPLAVGIDRTGLAWLSPLVKISALFGLFSTMLVTLLGQTRVFFSMSRDGLLPRAFGTVHSRFKTPHLSTALTGSNVAVAAGLVPIGVLGQLVSMGTLLAFVLVCIGILVLRRISTGYSSPFRTPGLPWVPIAGALICLVQMSSLPLGHLGAADHLAGDWAHDLLLLQPTRRGDDPSSEARRRNLKPARARTRPRSDPVLAPSLRGPAHAVRTSGRASRRGAPQLPDTTVYADSATLALVERAMDRHRNADVEVQDYLAQSGIGSRSDSGDGGGRRCRTQRWKSRRGGYSGRRPTTCGSRSSGAAHVRGRSN